MGTQPGVEEIYIAPAAGAKMQKVEEVEAVAGLGLRGDRYCERKGLYSGVDECQVTLIEGEGLDQISRSAGLRVKAGEHRRNIVTRGIRLDRLSGKLFQIGEAILQYDRPRPPCGYLQSLTQPDMARALMDKAGICARVVKSGMIRTGDPIRVLGRVTLSEVEAE